MTATKETPVTCVRPHVFIPAKNESETIARVIRDVRAEVERVTGHPVVVVVGDDGSTDRTRDVALDAGAEVIHHPTSIGLGNNFRRGLEFALENGADLLLTIDADGQFNAKEAEKLITPVLKGEAVLVSGSRFSPESKVNGISALKRWGNHRVAAIINRITGKQFADVSCGYRVYSKEALFRLNLFGGFTYTHEVFLSLAYQGCRIVEVPIEVQYFAGRKSRIAGSIIRYAWQTSKIIVKSLIYYRPLWLMWQVALVQFVPGAAILLWLSVRFAMSGAISPYKYLAVIGGLLCVSAVFFVVVGLFLQLFSRIQRNLDIIVYYEKRQQSRAS